MDEMERTYDFMKDVMKQNEHLLQLLESFDSRVVELETIVKECEEQLQDALHFSEYFEDREPAVEEYAKIGMKIAELRTRRRDAKKALFVLQQNRSAIKGLAPAVKTADSKLQEPSKNGNPSYYMYRLRNDESMNLISELKSFDMTTPVQIVGKMTGKEEADPDFFKPKVEAVPVETPVIPERTEADPPPLNIVRQEKVGYSLTYYNLHGEMTKKFDLFIEVIAFIMNELNASETQFVGKAYKSFQTFAYNFRGGKQRNAQDLNPMQFERLAANAYCG